MGTEPVAIVNAVSFAIRMILYAVLAFGVGITEDQLLAVVGAVEATGLVFVTIFTRRRVTSPVTAAALAVDNSET
jgi:hypothetical protein